MKSKKALKIGLGLFTIVILCLVSFKSFAHKTTKIDLIKSVKNDSNIMVTIDKKTTPEEFDDIKKMLAENAITATFNNIERNDLGEVTSLKIELKDSNNETESQISSFNPIAQITFGRKDHLLFITQGKNEQGAFGLFNQSNMQSFGFDNDSIVGQYFKSFGNFNFDDFFNDDNKSFFFGGKKMSIDQIKKQFESSGMNFYGLSRFFDSEDNAPSQFNFIDSPDFKMLIIIDGKESDFKTLNALSKEDKVKAFEQLKPEIAISLYGEKAKDGAIIAITKK